MKLDLKWLRSYFGAIIIAAAFIASAVTVYLSQHADLEAFHIVRPGETLASIAASYSTTIDAIISENYPDVQINDTLKTGMKVRLPKSARGHTVTVRLAHWQLEPGVRDAVTYMAAEYSKLHPNVTIVQNTVPESTYGQWFITQMVGGTAPDLIECALGVPYNLLIGYYMRYFTPLTDQVMSPNPYNKDNEFRDVALRDTSKDGFKFCYISDLQEYMTIQLSVHMVRFYYNKELLKKLTGRTNAPASWKQFIDVCNEVKEHKYINRSAQASLDLLTRKIHDAEVRLSKAPQDDASARDRLAEELRTQRQALSNAMDTIPNITPIANSSYHMNVVEGPLFNAMTTKAQRIIDYNHDCTVSAVEQYIGFATGAIDLDFPAYRARFAMTAQYCSNSIPGFVGLRRDDAVLQFVQGRSVFMVTGTWDANMLMMQAKDNGFTVGIMDFPYPDKESPELFRHFAGPSFEDPGYGFVFGCATAESEPERKRYAIDFLLFLASKENNMKLNEIMGWIPTVRGGEGKGVLKDFVPHVDGVTSGWNPQIGGESIIKWQQVYALYQVGQLSFENMRDEFVPYYKARGERDYLTVNRNWRQSIINDEKINTMMRIKWLSATNAAKREEYRQKYHYVKLRLSRELDAVYERSLLNNVSKGAMPTAAFSYSPEAKQRLGIR